MTLVLITIAVFLVVRALPGDATISLMAETGFYDEVQLELIRSDWRLDEPVPVQYWYWLRGVVQGDFGHSFYSGHSVVDDFRGRLPATAELTLIALAFALLMGVSIGILAAIKPNSMVDYGARGFAVLGLSIPEFWLGTLIIVLPAFWFGWLPPLTFSPIIESPGSNLRMLVPAALTLSFILAAVIMRLMRSSMLEVITSDYIRTARAKGLHARVVVWRHALRNALIPVLTVVGIQLATLLGGTVVIETVFNIPGVGRQTLQALQFRDYPQLQFNILFFAIAVMLTNLVVDIAYAVVDPRIRYGK